MSNLLNSQYYLTHPGLFTWTVLAIFVFAIIIVTITWVAIDRRRNTSHTPTTPTKEHQS